MKKDILYGVVLLFIGLFVYHFVAANQAEEDLKRALTEANAETDLFFTLNIGEVKIHPFAGDIYLEGIKAINRDHILDSESIKLDLSYGDFLNIYLRGAIAGLENVENGKILLNSSTYTWRTSFIVLNFDELQISNGKSFLSLFESAKQDTNTVNVQPILLTGRNLTITQQPISVFGTIRADHFRFSNERNANRTDEGFTIDTAAVTDIMWTPPRLWQERYEVFINGFGFQPDSIPVQSIAISGQLPGSNRFNVDRLTVKTDLFRVSAGGTIDYHPEVIEISRFSEFNVKITDFSESFSRFLSNAREMFDLHLPGDRQEIRFSLNGPINNPELTR